MTQNTKQDVVALRDALIALLDVAREVPDGIWATALAQAYPQDPETVARDGIGVDPRVLAQRALMATGGLEIA